jgi:hypothetical protein
MQASSSSTSKSGKGRKRKTEVAETSSRRTSIKAMPSAESAAKHADRTKRDQWKSHKADLEELVRGLHPEDVRGHRQINKVLSAMGEISHSLSSSHKHSSSSSHGRYYASG